MRPGCDDDGACDCGYLDSVMREGYQQDYNPPPDTAFEREMRETFWRLCPHAPKDQPEAKSSTMQSYRACLTSTLVRQMAACLASINVQQIVNGKVGQELRATEISEILEAYRQACEGKT